jgi:microcystin-dependent protein
MADQFIAEIRLLPFNFAPKNWAVCHGQILSISQNTALFSLLGTMYGGNGTTNFALPRLDGSVALHQGQGPGLSPYVEGQTGGVEAVTLITTEIPSHTHQARCSSTPGNDYGPGGDLWAPDVTDNPQYGATKAVTMAGDAVGVGGSSQPHNNMQPYLVLNYCISLVGIYPPRG